MPAERYHFSYADESPYGHAVGLLAAHTHVPGGIVLDVGCGYGAIAEPVRDLGLSYLGVDLEEPGVADLVARGFEAAVADLSGADALGGRLEVLLAGRPLAAITALDVLEHLTNGPAVLGVLRALSVAAGRAPLVVSIPNVAHLDLAAKLLIGRWDVTPTGLLDETHVCLYAPARLEATFEDAGWAEVGEADFELVESDQHFPAGAPVLAPTPLHDLLAGLRRRAAPGATTNQFVRAYVPVAVPVAVPGPEGSAGGEETGPAPFLSVLVLVLAGDGDGGGDGDDRVADTLVALDGQSLPDLEVVLCTPFATPAERSRLEGLLAPFAGGLARRAQVVAVPLPPGDPAGRAALLDAGVRAARGRYVTALDDGAVPFAHHVEVLARLAADRPGSVVRSLALSQRLRAGPWPGGRAGYEPAEGAAVASAPSFDLLGLLEEGGSPPGSYALPVSCFADLGLRFAGATPGVEDDEVLARAAMWCGVHEDPTTAILLQRRPEADAPGPAGDRSALLAALDAEPVLLPAGSLGLLLSGRAPATHPATHPAEGTGPAAAGAAERPEDADAQGAGTQGAGTEAALAAAQAALASSRGEVAALRASTSWRITAPLRWLAAQRAPRPGGEPGGERG